MGARPQFIKAFPVSKRLREADTEILVHTGQHYDVEMSGVFFEELQIAEPDHDLAVGSGTHAEQTAAMLVGLERLISEESPDIVLVYGDTNSTLAGALAATKLHVPVAHVEAGLRSFDRRMPEEVNRVLTDHVSSLLFCPTDAAVHNLAAEGISDGVRLVGDVMVDTAYHFRDRLDSLVDLPDELRLPGGSYVLATIHRPSNTDDPAVLTRVVDALCDSPRPVIFPVHPRCEKNLREHGLWDRLVGSETVVLSKPRGYLDMLKLMDGACVVATDSGGLQKEAYVFGVPCVTLRDTTEWVETVEAGWNVLVGADAKRILAALADPPRGKDHPDFYGDGTAAARVVDTIRQWLAGN